MQPHILYELASAGTLKNIIADLKEALLKAKGHRLVEIDEEIRLAESILREKLATLGISY